MFTLSLHPQFSAMGTFLRGHLPALDDDMLDYLKSIVDDSSLEEDERIELMADFLNSSFDSNFDYRELSEKSIMEFRREKSNNHSQDLKQITQKAVAACLEVMRAPEIRTSTAGETGGLDEITKKLLLKQYDDDTRLSRELVDDEDEILGLGRNENRMRITREREELRAAAKQEQLDAQAERVAQKLKSQGERIKDKTVRGKRS